MKTVLHILFCDDDQHFARTQAGEMAQKLCKENEVDPKRLHIEPISNLSRLQKIVSDPKEATKWDAIFCDLGWGDLTLEGIQILHDIQMNHPNLFTLLYTAQDENAFIDQAMEWKFHFIDRILRVGDKNFFNELVQTLLTLYLEKEGRKISDIQFAALHLLPQEAQRSFSEKMALELKRLQRNFTDLLKEAGLKELGAEVSLSPDAIKIKLKHHSPTQQMQKYQELIDNIEKFPRVAAHDLLALSKPAFLVFIKKKYGGFPQMAADRRLDLNNLYRVNRRFKNAPFIVFKYETIQEMVGSYEEKEREETIHKLLSPTQTIRKIATSL